MNINHHPDDATLVSYSNGSLTESFQILVGCHLSRCPQCRQRVIQGEQLGGAILESIDKVQAIKPERRQQFLQLINTEQSPAATDPSHRQENLPTVLQQLLDHGDKDLPWKMLAPGMQQIKLESSDNGLKLLRIAPGKSMPLHSHNGSELTMVLQGAFQDEIGSFYPGDVADLDHEVEHQPITIGNQACICLIAMDAPLKFQGLLPKLLQPFIGF